MLPACCDYTSQCILLINPSTTPLTSLISCRGQGVGPGWYRTPTRTPTTQPIPPPFLPAHHHAPYPTCLPRAPAPRTHHHPQPERRDCRIENYSCPLLCAVLCVSHPGWKAPVPTPRACGAAGRQASRAHLSPERARPYLWPAGRAHPAKSHASSARRVVGKGTGGAIPRMPQGWWQSRSAYLTGRRS
jgi:hypothetical protein